MTTVSNHELTTEIEVISVTFHKSIPFEDLPVVQVHFTSEMNSYGITRAQWFDGDVSFLQLKSYHKYIELGLELFPDKLLYEICLHFRLLMYCVLTKCHSNVPAKIICFYFLSSTELRLRQIISTSNDGQNHFHINSVKLPKFEKKHA